MFDHYPLRFMFAFGISIAAAVGFAAAWYRASRRVRELEDRMIQALSGRTSREPASDVLDVLAERVDDIANGQDFLNRVLSERISKLPVRRTDREATPV